MMIRIPPSERDPERFLELFSVVTASYEDVKYFGEPKGKTTVHFTVGYAEYFGAQAEFVAEKLRQMATVQVSSRLTTSPTDTKRPRFPEALGSTFPSAELTKRHFHDQYTPYFRAVQGH